MTSLMSREMIRILIQIISFFLLNKIFCHHQMTMNNRQISFGTMNDSQRQLLKNTSSEIFQNCTTTIDDELKFVGKLQIILEERFRLDEQYGRNLQELTATGDRIPWPTPTHQISSVLKEIFLEIFFETFFFLINQEFKRFYSSMVAYRIKTMFHR